jgi:NADH dehydrogenase
MTKINLPETDQPRIVIVGGGFAGLALARQLAGKPYQVVLIDRNNYHQFQPLFYQVAMAGLEPSSIVFPFRKLFQDYSNVYIRVTEVSSIETENRRLITPLGIVNYDILVIATGAETNFFGNAKLAQLAIPMKSVSEALYLRNAILDDYEKALTCPDEEERQGYLDIVIVGGGPTGVEVAGSLAEMKQYILPKDYPELNVSEIDIHLIQGSGELLTGMSSAASQKALAFLKELGVHVKLNTIVVDYDGEKVSMNDGTTLRARKVIWAAGVTGAPLPGLPQAARGPAGRIRVDHFHKVQELEQVYAIGDIAYMEEEAYTKGHPQLAQAAMQQAANLAANLLRQKAGKSLRPFKYRNLGAMATIGRHRAVVDLPRFQFQGAFAWLVWLLVHLFQILGVKNKVFVFFNWVWNYLTYDQSLRLIIRPKAASDKNN